MLVICVCSPFVFCLYGYFATFTCSLPRGHFASRVRRSSREYKKQNKKTPPTISKTGAHCNVIVRFSSGRRTNTLRGCLRLWICWTDTTIWKKKKTSFKIKCLEIYLFFPPTRRCIHFISSFCFCFF